MGKGEGELKANVPNVRICTKIKMCNFPGAPAEYLPKSGVDLKNRSKKSWLHLCYQHSPDRRPEGSVVRRSPPQTKFNFSVH